MSHFSAPKTDCLNTTSQHQITTTSPRFTTHETPKNLQNPQQKRQFATPGFFLRKKTKK
jgi:hypothetical protein